jgi:hypothetical protein
MHKTLYHQVAIDKKLAPLEVASRAEALEYRTELGEDNVDIFQGEGGEWFVQVKQDTRDDALAAAPCPAAPRPTPVCFGRREATGRLAGRRHRHHALPVRVRA